MSDLASLKTGDLVMYETRYHGWDRGKIEKVLPSGRIRVEGKLFDRMGCQIGGDTWSRIWIKPYDPDIWKADQAQKRMLRMRRYLAKAQWSYLPEQLIEVMHAMLPKHAALLDAEPPITAIEEGE